MKIKSLLLLLIFTSLLMSCPEELKYKKYTLDYEIEVTYNNGEVDTLSGKRWNNYKQSLNFKFNQGDIQIGQSQVKVACFVRSFVLIKNEIYLTDQSE